MRNFNKLLAFSIISFSISPALSAAPVTIEVTGPFSTVSGTYAADLAVGDTINGSFVYDVDEANASVANTTPGTVPGHEYSSRYTFDGAPYGTTLDIPAVGGGLFIEGAEVLVNNDLALTAAETGGLVPDGTYDWLELLASLAVDVCPKPPGETCTAEELIPGDGEEWTLAIIGPTSWFSDGSLIPDDLPDPLDTLALIVGLEFDEFGDEIGFAVAPVTITSVSAVPLPAAFWLFASGVAALFGLSRRPQRS